MILFSESLLFCREFPLPAARGGCLVSRKPRLCLPRSGGGARSLRVTGSGEPGAGAPAQVRPHPQVLLAARLMQIPHSAQQALSRRRPAWPFALFYLIGWRGQRILPGEARGVLEMIDFWQCTHARTHLHTHPYTSTYLIWNAFVASGTRVENDRASNEPSPLLPKVPSSPRRECPGRCDGPQE